ncbi:MULTISPECIES: hypothetical protein [Acinetobacter]|jgi:hypothetical protein|uniref:hypothetical protein n=1 Tax=Acinetobacter TaxID=469 RepID=UPI001FB94A2A|nr:MULTISPECIES: hypothetical protein [Acinetobacter]MDI1225027.1 hypothetical protein [Acinetobacter sp.]UOH18161.1 hypothetical protein MTO68_20550 [Acinetobacter sp. NyZ410]
MLKDTENFLGKIGTTLAFSGFFFIIITNNHQFFYQNLRNIIALQNLKWKAIHIDVGNDLSYNIVNYRNNTSFLAITLNSTTIIEEPCADYISTFCTKVKDELYTPNSFSFYVSYDPNDQPIFFYHYILKDIHFTNDKNEQQTLPYLEEMPNSQANILKAKSHLLNSIIYTGIGYFILVFTLWTVFKHIALRYKKITQFLATVLTATLIIHFVHFIIQFMISI